MNNTFKPLGLAAAVAAATVGYVGAAQATELAGNSSLGDLALIPYYTVNDGYATGMSIVNTSDRTQVIKVRLRRAVDSMDALDFSVVLSPEDVYTGTIAAKGDDIVFVSNDNSCTAPAMPAGGFKMPGIYRDGAEEGYVEIISMGSPVSEDEPIAKAALHDSDGVPANCTLVRDNFYVTEYDPTATKTGFTPKKRGVINSALTAQRSKVDSDTLVLNEYNEAPDSLKVSYFIKSDETGLEFGNNAVHFSGHMDGASMTNQEQGVFAGDLQGFDHPDLNGGAPLSFMGGTANAASRGLYEGVRTAIGAEQVINDWSANDSGAFSVDTDWVVTVPGQYLMLDLPQYLNSLIDEDELCNPGLVANHKATDPEDRTCDFRDIPLKADFTVYDREERSKVVEPGELVVSPAIPDPEHVVSLDQEVNVIEWGNSPVLGTAKAIKVPKPEGAVFGWSNLTVTQSADKEQAICDFTSDGVLCEVTESPVPMVGFVAWQRNFDTLPEANYGRIVEHSYVVSAE
ncbi:hypothetical protein H2508_14265 [Parahaliea sp. F7430]|uniref:Uncharacterized protein n=1 Tax=Sediminihaliea albiluteola TaxID=2758564 RepID=A0A7W2YK59_9GAMM|nr:hypothetical protein [Sediminihaliea albiluteola]MBA6414276.1 hypothetical protein [Sediminihaliea albiluteola]